MSRDRIISRVIDPTAPLSAKLEAEIANLAAASDETIDFSDIPPLDEAFWANARRNPFVRQHGGEAAVRLDADVVRWLKTHGDIDRAANAVLRRAMKIETGLAGS